MCASYQQSISGWTLVVLTLTVGAHASLENYTVFDFLQDVRRFHSFDNVLFVRNRNASIGGRFTSASPTGAESDGNRTPLAEAVVDAAAATTVAGEAQLVARIMTELQVPVLQMNERARFLLKRHFSFATLSLVYLDGALLADHNGLLKTLVAGLRHMTQSNILFLLNYPEADERLLSQLFEFCWQSKMINVAALFADYQHTATFYSYTHFPLFALETKRIHDDLISRTPIYPYRLGNLRGYRVPYIIGGSEPRIIMYHVRGRRVLGGFAGHFLTTFARKFNCTLYEPLPAKPNAFAAAQQLIAAVRNGTVEISAGLTFPSIPIAGYTYPYEQLNWCLMMPVEADIPGHDFYWVVFEGVTFFITLGFLVFISVVLSSALYQHGYQPDLLDFVLHDNCLRGALGQSFAEIPRPPKTVRFIYLQICVLGILLTTWFNSYFSTYVTSAPKVAAPNSFDEVLHSGTKVFVWAPEYNELLGRTNEFKKYIRMFHIEPSYRRYLQTRDSFNTKYWYLVPTTKWVIINEQQKVFTTPIFRIRNDLCIYQNIPMCFPVQDNSLFMETLYQLILETAQSGLMDYWQQHGFLEMIISGKLSFADLSTKTQFKSMKVDDLRYIWMGFGVMGVAVTLVFVGEQCTFRRRKIGACLQRTWRRWCSGERIKWRRK